MNIIKSALKKIYFKVRVAVNKITQYIERLRGLDFSSGVQLEELGLSAENSEFYMASDMRIRLICRRLPIKEHDAILDYGSGKGKMIYEFSKFNFKKVDGVEISPKLCEIAENNLRKLNVKNSEIFRYDASDFKAINDYTYFYFYNPFPNKVMLNVLDNIYQSLEEAPRQVQILYFNPVCHNSIVEKNVFKHIKTKWNVNIYSN